MVKLFYSSMCDSSRSVLLLAKAIDLPLELQSVNLMGRELFTEDFLKINPQHSVPLMDDDGFYLSESGAINMYLVEKYGKDNSLYPNDVKKRAIINQRLLFVGGVLWLRFLETYIIPVGHQSKGINVVELAKLDDAFNTLEKYLDGQKWLAGDEISVADYNYVTIISSAEAIGYDLSKYENVSSWLTRAKGSMEDYYELNQTGVDEFSGWFYNKLNQIESQDK